MIFQYTPTGFAFTFHCRGHTYQLRMSTWDKQAMSNAFYSWIENPELDFTTDDAFYYASHIGTVGQLLFGGLHHA